MKRFYAGGIIYNTHSKKILLQKREEKESAVASVWSIPGGLSKSGETPAKALQRELYEDLRVRIPLKTITPLYDYFNDDFNTHRHVFVVLAKDLKDIAKMVQKDTFTWVSMETIFKSNLSPRTRQDLIFFQREMAAKRNHLPTSSSL